MGKTGKRMEREANCSKGSFWAGSRSCMLASGGSVHSSSWASRIISLAIACSWTSGAVKDELHPSFIYLFIVLFLMCPGKNVVNNEWESMLIGGMDLGLTTISLLNQDVQNICGGGYHEPSRWEQIWGIISLNRKGVVETAVYIVLRWTNVGRWSKITSGLSSSTLTDGNINLPVTLQYMVQDIAGG